MGKRYYWLKLPDDFFRQKPIKKLRKIAGGDTYTIIYLKMLLISLKNEGKLFFDGVEENFAEEVALELDEEEENVKVTVRFLMAQGLLQLIDESEYELTECSRMVGSESASAERMRRLRDAGDQTVTSDAEKKQNTVAYVARFIKDCKCYSAAGKTQAKLFPIIKKNAIVDVMKYTETVNGKKWYFIRIPHPTEGFVREFVPAGYFKKLI